MQLAKLLQACDKPFDGLVTRAHKDKTPTGDTLAVFVARELADVYDPDASDAHQISHAKAALEAAADNLLEACQRLEKLT